ncbi:glycosyltransferase family A protein [Zoogloeaceae bacterium G21618-S1]|nr:glycosyltransferase family A protein [Zoogloeaceae bacterium G21618-S1]
MLVSLILATVGRSEDVGRCLWSLAAQTDQNFEVLLVDQNADERLVPWVEALHSAGLRLRHLRMDKASLSGARNLGIAESQGEIIGFPDDDCWYEPEVVARLRDAFLAGPGLDGVVANWVEQSDAMNDHRNDSPLSSQAWRTFRGGTASSISLFFRRALFDRLRGFDERMGVGCWFGAGEETDFILRALADGALIQRLPAARVHHLFGAPNPHPLDVRCRAQRSRARGTGALYAKHRLSPYTIVRGIVAPPVMPLFRLAGWSAFRLGLSTAQGRCEGFLRWGWGKS